MYLIAIRVPRIFVTRYERESFLDKFMILLFYCTDTQILQVRNVCKTNKAAQTKN